MRWWWCRNTYFHLALSTHLSPNNSGLHLCVCVCVPLRLCHSPSLVALMPHVSHATDQPQWYRHAHNKPMSCPAVAQMASIMLYQKRFFPYYVYTILGGLDTEGTDCAGGGFKSSHIMTSFCCSCCCHYCCLMCSGKGVVYSFDPVGSYERQLCRAGGSAASLIQPFLDNQVRCFRCGIWKFVILVPLLSLSCSSSFHVIVIIVPLLSLSSSSSFLAIVVLVASVLLHGV